MGPSKHLLAQSQQQGTRKRSELCPKLTIIPVGTRYCKDTGFLLGFHRDADRLRIEIEMTLLYNIFFQYHNDLAAIT